MTVSVGIIPCDRFLSSGRNHSESRVPLPGSEDGFSTKSSLCRTMTVSPDLSSGVNLIPPQSQFSSSSSRRGTNLKNFSSENKMSASFGQAISQRRGDSLARLLRESVSLKGSDHCSSYHYPVPFRPTHNHWAFGMIAALVIILVSLPSSSMVLCVPVGEPQRGEGEHGGRIQEQPPMSYSIQDKGQLYLPSLFNSNAPQEDYGRGGGVREVEGNGGHNYHHRFNPSHAESFLQRGKIQKDIARGAFADGKDDDDGDGGTPLALNGRIEEEDLGQSEWETVIDPHLYLLTEWNSPPSQEQFPLRQQQRKRRNSGTGPSLSIVNPLDVLRQRLLLEIARRRMRQSHNQIIANEEILRKIGRRR